ncbi:MAG: PD-(D/E)XK nuclease family protein, partial [Acutalibacteraceae bacterium]|nr:PD-(D/E)XK nuclease family protein [Acutalibacteraceae bacterium]
ITLSTECRNNKVDESSIRFRVTADTYHKIRVLAKRCGQTVKEIYEPFNNNLRTDKDDLKAVEENLYAFPLKSYNIESQNIKIYSATNIYSECEYVASEIKKLTLEEDYRYKDIAVVCRDEEMYRGILDVTFDKFNIGYFMDNPENINAKPLVNFIRHAFEAINNGFNTENILRMLKTNITKYSFEDISLLENYIFTWSPKWSEPFTQNINGFGSGEMIEEDIETLEKIENIRQEVFEYLKNFKEKTQKSNGFEISKQIAKLIDDFNVKNTIQSKIKLLDNHNTPELVDEYTRVWNSVTSVISKMSQILEKIPLTSARYYELFTLAINSQQIANQPLSIDRVIVGTAGRARLGTPKITFIIGAVQGVFPAVPTSGGVFTDNERQLLLELGLPMSCGLSDLSAQEQYSAYSSLASPSEKLYISYFTNTVNGGGALPSTIVTQVQRILPKIKTIFHYDSYAIDEDSLWCKQQAFEHTVANIKNKDKNIKSLKEYFSLDEKYNSLLNSIEIYLEKNPRQISKDTAHMLYSENIRLSASRIEDFYNCGYLYFCKNGLKLKERRKARIDNRQYGSLIHFVMEKFLKQENLEDIIANTENYDVAEFVSKLTAKFISQSFENGKIPDNKTEYSIRRAEKNCVILVDRLIKELKVSLFRPSDFELSIGIDTNNENTADSHNMIDSYNVKTKDGEVSVIGFVDRVDLFKSPDDGKTYVRIVDYKTGNKDLKRCELEMGLNLQMFIYLSAIMKNGSSLYGNNLAPAGVCYMPAKEFSAILTQYGESPENQKQLEDAFNKHYRAKGLFLKDTDVIMAMDKSVSGQFIPVKIKKTTKKKKGEEPKTEVSFTRSDNYLLDGSQHSGEFKNIFDLVDNKIRQMSDMLLEGYINSVPTGKKNEISELPCKYCLYKNSCNFTAGMTVNIIPYGKEKEEDDNNG